MDKENKVLTNKANAMEIKTIQREFVIEKSGVQLPDPDPKMSVEHVQMFYSGMYSELTTATVHKEFTHDKYLYTFKTVIGTKG